MIDGPGLRRQLWQVLPSVQLIVEYLLWPLKKISLSRLIYANIPYNHSKVMWGVRDNIPGFRMTYDPIKCPSTRLLPKRAMWCHYVPYARSLSAMVCTVIQLLLNHFLWFFLHTLLLKSSWSWSFKKENQQGHERSQVVGLWTNLVVSIMSTQTCNVSSLLSNAHT